MAGSSRKDFECITTCYPLRDYQVCKRKKRPALLNAGAMLIHDSATPHTSNPVKTVIDRYNWEILPHPSYFPDLSPCDYDLFPKLKMSLRGARFEDVDELKVAVRWPLHRITLGCLTTGITDLPKRWNAVIQQRGQYFEGQ